LSDCSERISREHYISENVLYQLGKTFLVTTPELRFDRKELAPKALAAKILCQRHNEALSGLDAVAGHFFRALRAAEDRVCTSGGVEQFNGPDIERWLLKMLCGYLTLTKDPIPEAWTRILFCYNDIVDPCGLHINVALGEDFLKSKDSIGIDVARRGDDALSSCRVTLHGYQFLLGLDGERIYDDTEIGKQSVLRPAEIRWVHTKSGATYRLAFTWHDSRPRDAITVSFTPNDRTDATT
jgi:hypothetical protein